MAVVADLRMEVSDHRGDATAAHLHNDGRGLVLDVDSPGVLLRALPPRRLFAGVQIEHLAGLSLRVRSAGVDLGTVSVTANGGTRIRPTVAGAGAAVRLLAHEHPVGLRISVGALVVLVFGWARGRIRR